MLTVRDIEEKIAIRINGLLPAEERLKDPRTLLSVRMGDLPLDSLDFLTLAMKLEDDLGRSIEVDEFDDALIVSELAQKLVANLE